MTGAEAALAALRDAEREALAPIRAAVLAVQQTQAAFRAADDLTPAMVRIIPLVIALEALEAAAKQSTEALRARLAAVMADTGATALETETHRADIRDAPPAVILTDEAAIPPELWLQPKPHPDRRAIGKLLARGESVPGAAATNAGRAVLYITPKRQRAA